MSLRIGIDTGGTFTDIVRIDEGGGAGPGGPGAVRTLKVPSTPEDPAEALLAGLAAILPEAGLAARVVHGTTVATNALLERRVARTALVTNAGMEDLVEIGRQARPDLYALHPEKPPPLVPRELRFGIGERRAAGGEELSRETEAELAALEGALEAAGVEAVAVCLLHSTRDPSAERRVAERFARRLGIPVTASGLLLAEVREFERFETAVANAALTPVLSRYLARIERDAGRAVLVMRSDGGLAPASAAAREPVRTLLSGPAGGLVGAARAARRVALGPFLSLDVGGTSTDVALSGAAVRPTGEVGGVRVAVPALDVVSVGAGGGSIAWIDAGRALRVGPRSAGASPGPACYGRSEEPTLTDAALVLGRLDPRFFLGGAMTIDPARAEAAVRRRIAGPLGLSLEAAAAGIIEVALAATERALRRVSVERGEDPRERALVAFGGAGGLLAAALADRLSIRRVLVPEHPGLLSALGMAGAPLLFQRSAALLVPLRSLAKGDLESAFRPLETEVLEALAGEGVSPAGARLVREMELRYEGQSHEIRIAWRPGGEAEDFHAAHERRNGFRDERRAVEVVAVHVAGLAEEGGMGDGQGEGPRTSTRTRTRTRTTRATPEPVGRAEAGVLYRREDLEPGVALEGPAVVGEYSGTTVVPGGWRLLRLASGDLSLERASDG